MAVLSSTSSVILAVIASYVVYGVFCRVPIPEINLDEWWGPNSTINHTDKSIRQVHISFSDKMIKDLQYRLRHHRPYTRPLEGINSSYGFNHDLLETVVKYWAEKYPFKKREQYLNQYEHYKVNIQGLDMHFVWVRAKNAGNKKILPLLLLHGWPGSILEFYSTIKYLVTLSADKPYAFDIVLPSLPGFALSDAAVRPGMGCDKAAVVIRNLMQRLGYKRYYIQAGDVGSSIAANMAAFFPLEVLGYHTNLVFYHSPEILFRLWYGSFYPDDIIKPELADRIYPLIKTALFVMQESGYLHLQSTKPDTVGVGLCDSPSGLAAYILEKFTFFDRGITEFFTMDELLDNVMLYWTYNAMNTAIRLYAETFNRRYFGLRLNELVTPVPLCVLQSKYELIYLPPELIMLKFPNLLNETVFINDGGHFLAWEKPERFSRNVVEAIDRFENWHLKTNYTWPMYYPNYYNQLE